MIKIITVNTKSVCSVENCGKPVDSKGFCRNHYMMQYLYNGRITKINSGEKRNHPLYGIWWQRKQDKELCEEWLDFLKFIKDVSSKPEGNYLLVKLRNEPFGPNNFKWQEHLKRKKDETKKEWYARKWAARQAANPSMESERSLKRKYGINRQQYNEILKSQNYVCAICEKDETSVDGKTGTLKKLAVDHCHKTGKIRELLCWNCNGTLGKIDDSLEYLKKIEAYLIKHKET